MSRIGKAGPDRNPEAIRTFRREEDGTYTQITKIMSRDWKTGGISVDKKSPIVEEGPYELVASADESDAKIEYEDIDGSISYLYLKKSECFMSSNPPHKIDDDSGAENGKTKKRQRKKG